MVLCMKYSIEYTFNMEAFKNKLVDASCMKAEMAHNNETYSQMIRILFRLRSMERFIKQIASFIEIHLSIRTFL